MPSLPRLALALGILGSFASGCSPSSEPAPSGTPAEKVAPGYASLPGQILAQFNPSNAGHSPEQMAAAASAFLQSVGEDIRPIVQVPLNDPERKEWTNSPASSRAGGIALGTLARPQLEAAFAMFATVLSDEGFNKLRGVMLGDDLRSVINDKPNNGVGIEDFRVVLFGNPALGQAWALQLDGHHVAINVSVGPQGEYSMSPSFIGTFPQEFTVAGQRYRPLDGEVDLAYALLNSLSAEQLTTTVISDTRQALRTGAGQDGVIPDQTGIAGQALDIKQKELLLSLADRWISMMPDPTAQATRTRLESEIDATTFSWNGPTEPGQDVSYVIQSPSMIFEYGNDERGGAEGSNPVDHVHTMFRDFRHEYGER